MLTLELPTPDDTRALGVRLGRAVFPGAIVALRGELGAGKTSLVQGLAEGLGVSERVQSPTFILVCPHEGGRLSLWHADLYRLRSVEEAEALGLVELAAEGVLAVEWADRFPELLPDERLEISLDGEIGRTAVVRGIGRAHAALEAALG